MPRLDRSANVFWTHEYLEEVKKYTCFLVQYGTLQPDYVEGWMKTLCLQNQERMNSEDESMFLFMDSQIVQQLFTVCIRLRLPNEVRFLAIHIYDRFTHLHLQLLEQFSNLPVFDKSRKESIILNMREALKSQVNLRMCTAIQLASKEHSYEETLTIQDIEKVLCVLGTPYSRSAIRDSECRVFSTLGYTLPTSPIGCCESILKIWAFQYPDPKMNINVIWDILILVLDIIYIYREDIYGQFFILSGIRFNRSDVHRQMRDWFHLAACAIMCSIWSRYGEQKACMACPTLADTACVAPQSVYGFSKAFFEVVNNSKQCSINVLTHLLNI